MTNLRKCLANVEHRRETRPCPVSLATRSVADHYLIETGIGSSHYREFLRRYYHTVVSAPGYTTYYLWALAGNHRIQATADDPVLAWVGRTVPMLKALGH